MVLVLILVVLLSTSFANYALTTKTTNIIYGSVPYLTFDGGRTRVTNTEALLGISLSDGRKFTPATNNSRDNPIILPVDGQSFNDIGMLVPTDTDSIALSSLIGTPYNYWGDDDGDGQGIDGITATGSLNLSIVDNFNHPVARNEVLTICKAPYKLTLSNGEGRLTTRYGVPNESRFTAGNATYYINPKASPVICFARPDLGDRRDDGSTWKGLSAAVWQEDKGFLPQSVTPSSYGLNFPTTGANNLYFYLDIGGSNQALSWAPVSLGGITATMTDSTSTSVKVTLTGPFATYSQQQSDRPIRVAIASLPQVFELVGRDSSGNAVVKYGFELKQWFVNRGRFQDTVGHSFWCNYIGGYRNLMVKDLTNASCRGVGAYSNYCHSATPSSPDNYYRRHIGAGFFTEWGRVNNYANTGFKYRYPTENFNGRPMNDRLRGVFGVYTSGRVYEAPSSDTIGNRIDDTVLCVYPNTY
ncbi:hypothetical protein [Gilliamella apis]|nr:hypothetical protein [Gilliamella apis]OTQ34026.1 hypothetical protein B6C84_11360 [Gilliamella apis]OTQ34404.1 hypothetical protein B6C88_11395 [Gilliamella apis]OTQ38276.1 hypothetical protein B6D26_11355 [Gilliamella apis]OTQ39559.1 hypothetical protein B6C94_11355 [Gilliamella apis]OTQ45692.1 hypothetical protein B6C92_11290 [Gilliamella apis]